MNRYLEISKEIEEALEMNKPVVALESTIISHGMPYPQNVETALKVEEIVRENGAIIIVVATVVAPSNFWATTTGKSRRLHLITSSPFLPRYSISSLDKPTLSLPFIMAMVAGTAPFSLTISSTFNAVSTFCG